MRTDHMLLNLWNRCFSQTDNYSDKVNSGAEGGIRTPEGLRPLIYSQFHLTALVPRQTSNIREIFLEPSVGFEPTTYGLQNRCSTAELGWQIPRIFRAMGKFYQIKVI